MTNPDHYDFQILTPTGDYHLRSAIYRQFVTNKTNRHVEKAYDGSEVLIETTLIDRDALLEKDEIETHFRHAILVEINHTAVIFLVDRAEAAEFIYPMLRAFIQLHEASKDGYFAS